MTDLTTTAKKIMEVFRYFKIRENDTLSLKRMLTRKYLWSDLEEEEFKDALKELIMKGYIADAEEPTGWRLLGIGASHLKQPKR
jgi:hypothetical protein